MKRMTGIILMTIGGVSFLLGLIFFTQSAKTSENILADVEQESNHIAQDDHFMEWDPVVKMALADGVLTANEKSLIRQWAEDKGLDYESVIKEIERQLKEGEVGLAETALIDINKKNGNDFEGFIAKKFNRKYFTIKEWAGDKYVDGVYAATTQQPDLCMEFRLREEISRFSVECKWKSRYSGRGIQFGTPEQFKRYQEYEREKGIPVFIAIGVGGDGGKPEHLHIIPLKSINTNFVPWGILKRYEKEVESDFFFDPKTKALK